MMSNGADAASQSVSFQMINRLEFDERVSWIVSDNLDYNAQEDLDGYNDVVFTLTAPSDATPTLLFSAKTIADNHELDLQGLLSTDLLLQVNGATTAIASLDSGIGSGNYEITSGSSFSTGEAVTLSTFDSSANSYIIDVDGVLYKSNIATTVVV